MLAPLDLGFTTLRNRVLIGGADVATELDAKRAIQQGMQVALAI